METLYLLRYAELALKSQPVRKRMSKRLASNLKDALQRHDLNFHLERGWSQMLLSVQPSNEAQVEAILRNVFGMRSYSKVARYTYQGKEDLLDFAEEHFGPQIGTHRFAVRAKREQSTALSTREIERELGARLLRHGGSVDLTDPELTCAIECRQNNQAFLHAAKERAPGGLPLGVEMKTLSLLSGGFDSPVATWLMMRRGVPCDFLFFELGGLTQRGAIYAHLHHLYKHWIYGYRPWLHIIPGRPIVDALHLAIPQQYWNIMLKRTFYQVGRLLAQEHKHAALITGEAVAQVSSQTLSNLSAIQHQLEIPVLRPLLTYEKEEIIHLARRIGSHDISVKVQEYCAITPSKPATRIGFQKLLELERQLGGEDFYQEIFQQYEAIRASDINPDLLQYLQVIVDTVPKDAVWIDMRENPTEPLPQPARHVPMETLLTTPESLPPDQTYLLLCDIGTQSAEIAHMLSELGVRAYSFEGGIQRLRKHLAAV